MQLEKISDYSWKVPKNGAMRVDGVVYASRKMLDDISNDESLQQVINVATLPGIVKASLAMPDMHWGYGFPIGGVAAFDPENDGIVSPGGVGYDINCGVRLLRSNLVKDDVAGQIPGLTTALFSRIPTGVGRGHKDFKLSKSDEKEILEKGSLWAVERGFGSREDLEYVEANGRIDGADPSEISDRALERGKPQSGTVGSGNHFIEVGYVSEIFDENAAEAFGLHKDQITVQIHTGSRGLGHQVCSDFINVMLRASQKYGIKLPDKQLCCAPIKSEEGQRYLAAMACAANFAFANRHMLMHGVREIFEEYFHLSPRDLGLGLVYDVAHNIAKFETFNVDGKKKKLLVHRKGATRSYPAGHADVPSRYRGVGQPVLIPGDMGRYSYVLVGQPDAMEKTFGSTCHGAGRLMSRHAVKKHCRGRNIASELKQKGICILGASLETIVEEAPEAYKDVAEVVDVVHNAGLAKKVAKLVPLGVIKG